MKQLHLLLLFLLALTVKSQILTWQPVYFTEDSSVTIVFDATKGNAGLQGYTGNVYAHTGVLIESSTSPRDWYAAPTWLDNDPKYKLTRIDTNLYEFKISTSVLDFYSNATTDKPINSNDVITDLAFVFRNADASMEGKDVGDEDIFIELRTGVKIISPTEMPYNAQPNEKINITAVGSSVVDSLKLYVDNQFVSFTVADTLIYELTVSQFKQRVKVVGTNDLGITLADSFYYYVNPTVTEAELPAGVIDGINYIDDNTVTLSLYAAGKDFIYVIGDFNNWENDPNFFMNRTPDGERYWLTINNLSVGEEYAFQYLIDGEINLADPYSELVLDPWNDQDLSDETYPDLKPYPTGKTTEPVSVLETGKQPYNWQVNDFVRPPKDNLIIYELLIRDFVTSHSYNTLIDTLDYLETLGVNAIELMPINEFEGNISWGYNPSFMFAVDKYYGTRDALKRFIDECHSRGIAVILDMVLNHQFGQSPLVRLYWDPANNRPSAENPWFNQVAKHPFNVGYDMNHESPVTQQFVDRVNRYWLEEFRFDGYRYDLSKGFMQTGSFYDYNASRIALLKRMADQVWAYDSEAYLILEHLGANDEEKELANYGFMLWGKMTDNYNEATMGYNEDSKSDISWISYKERGWNDPHVVGYMESHDEERLMFKNLTYGNSSGSYDITNSVTAIQRMKMAAAFFFTIPGPKMIWQFGELGYDYSINYPSGTSDDRLTPKPIRWDYLESTARNKLYKVFSSLINLKKNYEVFSTDNFQLSVNGSIKKIKLYDDAMNVYIIGNFGVTANGQVLDFPSTGTWYDYFSGDSVNYTSSAPFQNLEPGEFHIYTTEKLPTPEGDIISGLGKLDEDLQNEFFLGQNYPNPFNPSTTISFSIPQKSFVNLDIFNILGQKVRSLITSELSAGKYEVQWKGENDFNQKLASGIYFYRIKAENFNQIKKMILLK